MKAVQSLDDGVPRDMSLQLHALRPCGKGYHLYEHIGQQTSQERKKAAEETKAGDGGASVLACAVSELVPKVCHDMTLLAWDGKRIDGILVGTGE